MEQRRLRLGDILDDYCPRERRVTNHAVVAMIEEDVKQTRCTTCEAEHAYKGARVPTRRKKETPAALYKEVLAGMPEADDASLLAAAAPAVVSLPAVTIAPQVLHLTPDPRPGSAVDDVEPARAPVQHVIVNAPTAAPQALSSEPDFSGAEEAPVVDGPVHRPLIRATLPRVEGQKDARPAPDFTIRHTPARGSGNGHGGFRGDRDRMRMRSGGSGSSFGQGNGNRGNGAPRSQGNRGPGGGRQPMGRAGGPPNGFRGNGTGNGNGNKRGRGSRG